MKRKSPETHTRSPPPTNHTTTTSNGHLRQHGKTRRQLPVFKYRSEICKLVAENEAVLIIAETVRFLSTCERLLIILMCVSIKRYPNTFPTFPTSHLSTL